MGTMYSGWRSAALAMAAISVAINAMPTAQVPRDVPEPTQRRTVASNAELRRTLTNLVDIQHKTTGLVVGIVTPSGRRVVAYGKSGASDGRPLDQDSTFHVGSITKVFTALMLADAIHEGLMAIDDPVSKYLPTSAGMMPLTLMDLATHTAALPLMPPGLRRDSGGIDIDAATNYTVDQLLQFVEGYQLPREPGAQWEYSNAGMSLLGHAVARRRGLTFPELVESRAIGPLRLRHTTVHRPAGSHVTVGHDAAFDPIPGGMDAQTFAPSGAMWSSAGDMLTFLEAAMGRRGSILTPSFALLLEHGRPSELLTHQFRSVGVEVRQMLGWLEFRHPRGVIIQHDGAAAGHTASIAYDPATRVGVVVLSNSYQFLVGDFARNLLQPDIYPVRAAQ